MEYRSLNLSIRSNQDFTPKGDIPETWIVDGSTPGLYQPFRSTPYSYAILKQVSSEYRAKCMSGNLIMGEDPGSAFR